MKYNSLVKLLVAGAAVAGISLTLLSGLAFAAQGNVGGRPANVDSNNPRTNDIFIHELDLGETASDTALLVNNTDEEKVLHVYAVDGMTTNTGALTCKQLAEEKTDAGKWIKVDESEVTLAPQSQQEVDFTVTVPKKADVGEHNACLVYQVQQEEPEQQGGISVSTRSATRVVVTVPGDLKKELIIEDFDITAENGQHTYKIDVKNNGNVSADAVVAVSLTGIFGEEAFSNSGQYPMLPREMQSVLYRNESLPLFGGFYTADVRVVYDGRPGVFGVDTEDRTNLVTLTEQRRVFIMPHPVVLAVALILIFAVLLWALWVMAARKKVNDNWEEYTVKKNDTLQSIAQMRKTSWKKLAQVNSLKAPYALEAKTKLLVPKEDSPPKESKE